MKAISTTNAPAAIGPYSQAIDCGDLVFVSGIIPVDPKTNTLVEDEISVQAHQIFKNMLAILAEAGLTAKNVVKTTVFLTDLSAFSTVNEIYASYFEAPYPARSCVEVSKLPKGARMECEIIAKK